MQVHRNRGYPALISPFTKYRLANPGGDHLEPCDTGSLAGHTIAASSCSTKGIPAMGFCELVSRNLNGFKPRFIWRSMAPTSLSRIWLP